MARIRTMGVLVRDCTRTVGGYQCRTAISMTSAPLSHAIVVKRSGQCPGIKGER